MNDARSSVEKNRSIIIFDLRAWHKYTIS